MQVTLSYAELLSLLEAAVSSLLAAMLFFAGKREARPLAGFLAVFALVFLLAALPAFDLQENWIPILRFMQVTQLLAVPFLYQYAVEVGARQQAPLWLHFMPTGVVAILILVGVLEGTTGLTATRWLTVAQVLVYLPVIILSVRQSRRTLENNFSSLSEVDLRWLELMCIWLLLLMLFDTILFPVLGAFEVPHQTIQFIFNLCTSLYILWLTQGALKQIALPNMEKPKASYDKSGLDTGTATSLAREVCTLMVREKLYLQPDLVLSDLANAAGVSNHILSEVLNNTIGKNFYDFVNSHRVEAAQVLLDETNKPILEIAFEAGFNNKASFNQAFKKYVQQTPSQYRNQKAA